MNECFAVVGLGNIAKRHRSNLKLLFPESKVIAVSASGRIPLDPVSDADEICSSIESISSYNPGLVVIASPAPFHREHAESFIRLGISVMIEKPITVSIEDAVALKELAASAETKVGVGYCLRFQPSATLVQKALQDGIIGRVLSCNINAGQYLPDWRPHVDYRDSVSARKELGGGVLLELSHELDYLQWLLGDLKFESGFLHRVSEFEIDVEALAELLLTTNDGVTCNVHLDFLQRQPQRLCSFIGTEGRLEWNLKDNQVTAYLKDKVEKLYSEPEWDRNLMYCNMLSSFVHEINGAKKEGASLSEAVKTVELINCIKQKSTWVES